MALGRDPHEGIHVCTADPVPEAGTVDIITVAHFFGVPGPPSVEPFPADQLARWRGYILSMHTFPPVDPMHPRKPTWDIFQDDGTHLYTLEIFRTRVQAAGDRLFAELLTLPGEQPRPGIFGWHATIPPASEIQRAVHGLQLLGLDLELVQELDTARKRTPGPVPDFKHPDELRGAVVTAIKAEWRRLRKKPSQKNVAGYFSSHPTLPRSTDESLGKRITRAALNWDVLIQEAQQELLREGRLPN